MKVDKEISEDEAALYDRQIRLWGVDAQKKLLASRVLLVNVQGLGAEIAKNLVLGGINSLTLLDSHEVQEDDLKYNFLLRQESLKKNRGEACIEALQVLNPLVKIDNESSEPRSKDASFYEKFDIVCALSTDMGELEYIDSKCREKNVMFVGGFVAGSFGFTFVDFGDFQYLVEAPKIADENAENTGDSNTKACGGLNSKKPAANEEDTQKLELVQKNHKYVPFAEFVKNLRRPVENISANKMKRLSKAYFMFLVFNQFFETHGRSFVATSSEDRAELVKIKSDLFTKLNISSDLLSDDLFSDESRLVEFTPVNAIMGGVMAQEIIKAISKKNEPIMNLFVFDGNSMSGEVMTISS